MSSSSPRLIDRYRVIDVLGAGGFATVYLAEDPRLDAQVAIKVLAANWALQPELRTRFIKEAQVMRKHAGIGLVAIHDIGEHDDCPFFVMEYCTRGTLRDRLKLLDRPLSVAEALNLARALRYATEGIHAAGIVHRDLKPSNFLIRTTFEIRPSPPEPLLVEGEELVVGDFGFAKIVSESVTRLSIMAGTPGYASPEQMRGDPTVDATADVYSLSSLLASALAGQDASPTLTSDTPPFDDDALALAGVLRDPLLQGLAFDRTQRQQSVDQWYQSLKRAAETEPIAEFQVEDSEEAAEPQTVQDVGRLRIRVASTSTHNEASELSRESPPRPRRRVRLLLAVLVALGLGAGLLIVSLQEPETITILGPTSGVVGEEVSFGTATTQQIEWSVNTNESTNSSAIAFTPPEPGTYTIAAQRAGAKGSIKLTVTEPTGTRLVGPSRVSINEPAEYSLNIASDQNTVWIINDNPPTTGSRVRLAANSTGTITIEAHPPNQEPASRTVPALNQEQSEQAGN